MTTVPKDGVIKRDRVLISAIIIAATLAVWGYLAQFSNHTGHTALAQIAPHATAWSASFFLALLAMWIVMMAGMMIPTAIPMVLAFATTVRRYREWRSPYPAVALFIFGYIVTWSVFSLAAATTQIILHNTAVLSPAMVVSNTWLSGALLIGAGIFQWSGLKQRCLAYCRSPLGFLMTQWRDGLYGAYRMGLKHGLYCVGCCWLLMALLFAVGVMNLLWGILITVFVLMEKVAPMGDRLARVAGFTLIVGGIMLIWHG